MYCYQVLNGDEAVDPFGFLAGGPAHETGEGGNHGFSREQIP